jgi:diguanylate cyclase (GGDEF)-like protein
VSTSSFTPGEDGAGSPGWLERARGLAIRLVEPWVPAACIEAGGERLRAARIIVGFTIVLLALAAETFVFFHWVLPPDATPLLDVALLLALAMVAGVPMALARSESPEPAANLVVGASCLVMTAVFWLVGGVRAPVLHWCALLPMLAVLMGGRRSAWIWGGAAALLLAGFAGIELADVPLPRHLEESAIAGERMWIQRVVDVGSWVGILFAVSLIYERQKDRQTADLGHANEELTREIAQRRDAEARTHRLAYYDGLTQLPNRQLFQERLEAAVAQAEQDDRMVAVMFLDLDGFKEVNDTFGHRLGDTLLQGVAERLAACVRNSDAVFLGREGEDARSNPSDPMVSRLGGDEFTVLLGRLRSEQEAALVARRILGAVERPFSVDGQEIHISTSIGIALYPGEVEDVSALLKSADLAMYAAKQRGKNNYQFFRESMNEEVVNRTTMANELRLARERGELRLHYQPIVDSRTLEIVKLEALIRWQHPAKGLVMPGAFIGIAEQTGQIVPISNDTLRRACDQIQCWRDAGLPPVSVAVNLSGVELRHGDLPEQVARILAETGLPPHLLDLEVTESAMMEDENEAALVLAELKELGVRIALDDFGTGYSSLSYVHRYPVDSIKIDRSFVRDVVVDPDAQAITRAIVAMAKGLQLHVVAEGVETEAQEEFLRGLGCDSLQGFRFSVPLPAHEVEAILERGIEPHDVG